MILVGVAIVLSRIEEALWFGAYKLGWSVLHPLIFTIMKLLLIGSSLASSAWFRGVGTCCAWGFFLSRRKTAFDKYVHGAVDRDPRDPGSDVHPAIALEHHFGDRPRAVPGSSLLG
jgi:hypothetical protein